MNLFKFPGRIGVMMGLFLLVIILMPFAIKRFDLFQEKDLLENPPSKRCADCHKRIYDQWKGSRHAIAWISDGYKKESENYSKQKCMGCHNPLEVSYGNKPKQRIYNLEEGVSCIACHLHNGEMHGPYELNSPILYLFGLFSPPHPFKFNRVYLKSGFCKGCHIKTYDEWRVTGSLRGCQECHMKSSREHMMDKFPFNLLHSKVEYGDHSMSELKAGAEDIRFDISEEDGELTIQLENINVPHDLPTAQTGDPRFYLEIKFFAEDNTIIEKMKEVFAPQLETALSYKKEWVETYSIPGNSVKINFSLSLKKPWKTVRDLLLTEELTL